MPTATPARMPSAAQRSSGEPPDENRVSRMPWRFEVIWGVLRSRASHARMRRRTDSHHSSHIVHETARACNSPSGGPSRSTFVVGHVRVIRLRWRCSRPTARGEPEWLSTQSAPPAGSLMPGWKNAPRMVWQTWSAPRPLDSRPRRTCKPASSSSRPTLRLRKPNGRPSSKKAKFQLFAGIFGATGIVLAAMRLWM